MSLERFLRALTLVAVPCTLLVTSPLFAQDAGDSPDTGDQPATLGQALKEGKLSLSLRYRFENVSDDAATKDAEASTLRTTLSYKSAAFRGWSVFLEAEDVTAIGDDNYNNAGRPPHLNNGKSEYSVVADPELTDVNQAYLSLVTGETAFRIGRQEVLIGNVRFVGNVGWRQNHQSFDGLSIVNTSLSNATLSYYYFDNANRIFGDNAAMSSHLLNGTFKVGAAGQLAVYGYSLDYDDLVALSTTTFGASFTNKLPAGSGHFLYDFEYAVQSDAGDNPAEVDAGYYRAELGFAKKAALKVGLEVLEGSPEDGKFTTPLATLHKWNGWADKFLATPADGLEDLYVSLAAPLGKWKLLAVYHEFSANNGAADYGTELDVQAVTKTPWGQDFGLKAALYEADTHSVDTEKVWLWTGWKF